MANGRCEQRVITVGSCACSYVTPKTRRHHERHPSRFMRLCVIKMLQSGQTHWLTGLGDSGTHGVAARARQAFFASVPDMVLGREP